MLQTILLCLSLSLYTNTLAISYDPSNKINQLALTMALLKQNYITAYSDNEIAEKAIRGLLNELDPHSDYLDINDFSSLNDSTQAQVSGIGIELTVDRGIMKVITPLDNSPAKSAGIQSGDIITHVNKRLILDIGYKEAITQIKGQAGTTVDLTIIREGQKKPIQLKVVREIIKAPTVKTAMLNPHIGYLRISYFSMTTTKDTRLAINKLRKQNPSMQGLIIDLRNNPGGVLESAVDVSDLFLNSKKLQYQGVITTAKERNHKITQVFKSKNIDITNNLPIAVVINAGSASGAEIMAGALKDHHRAIIVGERSFGKGSIQTVMPLSNTTAIKITTGLYYTPAGKVVQNNGITPDITSPRMTLAEPDLFSSMREGDYLKSLGATHKQQKNTVSQTQKAILETYGFEVYQAMQTLKMTRKGGQCQ